MKIKYKRKQIGCINVPSGKRPIIIKAEEERKAIE